LWRFADRFLGSHEIYRHEEREAEQSANFVTCHDGFTLNDLVSFTRKHNEANHEDNRDGGDDNRSWNCGFKGPSDDPAIEGLRNRQVKNFLTITLLSLGVPMILMGDEVRRTQQGNDNAYCQDSEISWFDWTHLEKHSDIRRFVQSLIAKRLLRDVAPEQQRMTLAQRIAKASKVWHGVKLNEPDWSNCSHCIAFTAHLTSENLVHLIFNAYWEPLEFELPSVRNCDGTLWHRWIDTYLDSPEDIVDWQEAPVVRAFTYRAGPRSVVVLWRRDDDTTVD
jgi:glycogen operon protein